VQLQLLLVILCPGLSTRTTRTVWTRRCASSLGTTRGFEHASCSMRIDSTLDGRYVLPAHLQHVVQPTFVEIAAIVALAIPVHRCVPSPRKVCRDLDDCSNSAGPRSALGFAAPPIRLAPQAYPLIDDADLVTGNNPSGGCHIGRKSGDWDRKMCSISVEPMPSRMSTPQRCRQRLQLPQAGDLAS
jgi:hypothetical protein